MPVLLAFFLAAFVFVATAKETHHGLAVGVLHAEMHDGQEIVSRPPTREQSRQQHGRAETRGTHPVWTKQSIINNRLVDPIPIVGVARIDLPELGEKMADLKLSTVR